MALRFYYSLSILLLACSPKSDNDNADPVFGCKVFFRPPELAVASGRAVKTIDNEIHGVSFLGNDGVVLDTDSIVTMLNKIATYEISNDSLYEVYFKSCGDAKFLTWKPKKNGDLVTRIEKVTTVVNVPYEDNEKNSISITDFDVYCLNKPKHLAIRMIGDYDVESLSIDNKTIRRVAESVPVGFEVATAKMDSLKKACR